MLLVILGLLTVQTESTSDLGKIYEEAREAEAHAAADPHQGLTSITIEQGGSGFATSSWEDRDRRRVLNSESRLVGSISELEDQVYLTRLGLYRRADSKFNEFVSQPMGEPSDGYGLWRRWESRGRCPTDILITDPWGTISWQEERGMPLRSIKCSWVVRPGMYRRGGYMLISRSPVTLSFRAFNLAAELEFLEIYDGVGSGTTAVLRVDVETSTALVCISPQHHGAMLCLEQPVWLLGHPGAKLLGRFTGNRIPHDVSSTATEVRVIYHANLNRTITQLWDEVEGAVRSGRLHAAVSVFALAARFGVRGFIGQDVRAAIRAIAIRASNTADASWMRRKWFRRDESHFDFELDAAIASVGQDALLWAKRSRHDAGKEHERWERLYSPRRFPLPIQQPEQNPLYTEHIQPKRAATEALPLVGFAGPSQTGEVASLLPTLPSRFLLSFVTIADCTGRGITTYGQQVFPPLTVSSTPEENFALLDFPIEVSSCQPMEISGMQRTRDQPFTIADAVRKKVQEDKLKACTEEDQCTRQLSTLSSSFPPGGNCTDGCPTFLACVEAELANRSSWELSGQRHRYNKSLMSTARQRCFSESDRVDTGNICLSLLSHARSFDQPKQSRCLNLRCLTCGASLYHAYFECARRCGEVHAHTHTNASLCLTLFYLYSCTLCVLCASARLLL